MENLFSYGTLQKETAQLKTFGRLLKGCKEVLPRYRLDYIKIKDEFVLQTSKESIHPILFYSGKKADEVNGTAFTITHSELLKADNYEVDEYIRVEEMLKSGKKAWVYIAK